MVVAIRRPLFVDRHDEVRLPFESFEARPAVVAASENIAEICVKIVNN